jgi:hypothetical protein
MNRTLFTLIPLTASLCIAPFLAYAQDARLTAATAISNAECAGAAHLSYVQGRIVEKAAQGIVPLRQFVWRLEAPGAATHDCPHMAELRRPTAHRQWPLSLLHCSRPACRVE